MSEVRSKNLIRYVIPTMLGSTSFFLFTIIDGIFVGQCVGTNALGAVDTFYDMAAEYLFWYFFGDWLLIFPLHMGLAGAAIATGISQTVTFLIVLSHFLMKQGNLRIKGFQFQGVLFKKIVMRGMPGCIKSRSGGRWSKQATVL